MKNTIYHNPNWSKSRKSVEILKNKKVEFEIIQYIKNPPSENEIKNICRKLNMKPKDIIRKNLANPESLIETIKFFDNKNVKF